MTYRRGTQWGADQDWRVRAACRDHDAELWFPTERGNSTDAAKAKRICGGCPVRRQCLDWALERAGPFGIAAGLTVRERDQVKRCRAGQCDHPQHQEGP